MAVADTVNTQRVYNDLRASPLAMLQNYTLRVLNLPNVACATVQNLYFAAASGIYGPRIGIDMYNSSAAGFVDGPNDSAIQILMVISPVRGNGLPVGTGPTGRHRATGILNAGGTLADLWVTPTQTGCSVLIVDWGGGRYSVTHLQPSQDAQFNQAGRALMRTGDFARNAYKNIWLKQEMTSVVGNTVGAPQRYIMIQSMFEGARNTNTQIIGIRNGAAFTFYRQRATPAHPAGGQLQVRVVEQLQWSTWYAYLPYFSY